MQEQKITLITIPEGKLVDDLFKTNNYAAWELIETPPIPERPGSNGTTVIQRPNTKFNLGTYKFEYIIGTTRNGMYERPKTVVIQSFIINFSATDVGGINFVKQILNPNEDPFNPSPTLSRTTLSKLVFNNNGSGDASLSNSTNVPTEPNLSGSVIDIYKIYKQIESTSSKIISKEKNFFDL